MTEDLAKPPAKSDTGADKPVRPRWFSRELQISLFEDRASPNKTRQWRIPFFSKELILTLFAPKRLEGTKQPKKPFRLYVPLLSKDLIITFWGDAPSSKAQQQYRRLAIPLPRPQAIVGLAMVIAGLVIAYNFGRQTNRPGIDLPASVTSVPAPVVEPEPVQYLGLPPSVPTKVRIPKIGVSATMEKLDKQDDGTIAVPKSFKTVGWYTRAPTPGEIGPAVLVGHVDNVYGPAVFYYLKDLKPGDIIEVDRADKSTVKFKVESLKQFSQDNKDFPTQKVYGGIDYSGLRLITCSGQFNSWTGRYSHNIVVFAKMVEET